VLLCRTIARLVELPGRNFAPAVGDADALFAEIERFCAEIRSGEWEELEPDRMLATVLFTDIVGSTQRMAELGDGRWREASARAPHCRPPAACALPRG
jgi:class 3 adenylate cyclase